MDRRAHLALAAFALAWLGPRPSPLQAAPTAEVQARRLENRRTLWADYASKTRNLVARYELTRTTSLLTDPMRTTGTLIFVAPDRLVLRDDGLLGTRTEIEGERARIATAKDSGDGPLAMPDTPGARWLAALLLRLFAPAPPDALTGHDRVRIPRARRGLRLELRPPRDHPATRSIRAVTVALDPAAGAVVQITIFEASGDNVRLTLTDHRQNVPDELLAQHLDERDPAPAAPPP